MAEDRSRSGNWLSNGLVSQPAPLPGHTLYGIALGSNLGDREANLRCGVEMLLARLPGAQVTAAASLYETDPIDCAPGTQAFLNTVIEMAAPVTPSEMHTSLMAVEQALGRPAKRAKNAPRPLDLDMLYAGMLVSDSPILTIPHPRLHQRRFVLQPLAEIRPDLVLPGFSKTIAQLLTELRDEPESVRRVW